MASTAYDVTWTDVRTATDSTDGTTRTTRVMLDERDSVQRVQTLIARAYGVRPGDVHVTEVAAPACQDVSRAGLR